MRENEPGVGADEIERRIDTALRSYSDPGEITDPRTAALTLLERAKETELRSSRPLRGWIIPVAVCLILLVIGAAWLLRKPRYAEVARKPAPQQVSAQAKTAAPPPICMAPTSAIREKRTRVLAAKARPLPKLDVFPTPTPLSPQEEALAAFAKHGPPAVQHAVIEDQKHWDDPIIVADLQEQLPHAGKQQDR